jgi:signal transduction histidine kinase
MAGTFPPTSRAATIRVLLVDDNAGFRGSLVELLSAEDLEVVGQASSGLEALEALEATGADVVLMDVRMPGIDGIETTRRLKERFPAIGVIALTGYEDQRMVRDMLVAGASGYVLKDSDGDEILHAVQQAASGRGVLSPGITPSVIDELTEALGRERRRTRQLEMAQQALLERAARRHELVSRLSHELRTPVTVVLGMARSLVEGHVGEEDRDDVLRTLVERAEALARLVQRFEAAVESGLTEWADVNLVVEEVAADNPRVRVEPSDGPAMAGLNRIAARRIVEELVENAVAFSPPEATVTVRIGVRGASPVVRVIDHGPGIDAADVDRIFAPLEQVEPLDTRTHQGMGFGLALARMSARAMDGDVILESTGPQGSTFTWIVSNGAATSPADPQGRVVAIPPSVRAATR